jgi:hypothetical protein
VEGGRPHILSFLVTMATLRLPALLGLPMESLATNLASISIGALNTGKRRVDGTRSDTRIGQTTSEKWTNERFRQTMFLILEFRREWPNQSLLTADDVEAIRAALDSALYFATSNTHTADSEASLLSHSNPFFGCLRVRAPHITHPPHYWTLPAQSTTQIRLAGQSGSCEGRFQSRGAVGTSRRWERGISLIRISLQVAKGTARAWKQTQSGGRNDWSSSAPI